MKSKTYIEVVKYFINKEPDDPYQTLTDLEQMYNDVYDWDNDELRKHWSPKNNWVIDKVFHIEQEPKIVSGGKVIYK